MVQDRWFRVFDQRELTLIVEDKIADGTRSSFNRLVRRESALHWNGCLYRALTRSLSRSAALRLRTSPSSQVTYRFFVSGKSGAATLAGYPSHVKQEYGSGSALSG